jgi:hypothetical protein
LTFDDELTACSDLVWITNYNDKENHNAASPKISALDGGCYLLMWERMSRNSYESTYMTIIDESGKLLTPIKQVGNVRLNSNDSLRYSRITGNVFWAVNSGTRNITIYSFNPDNLIGIKPSGANFSSQSSEKHGDLPQILDFAGSFGVYLNGWHQNLVSLGAPLQLGLEFNFANMALAVLGEAVVGVGVSSITELRSPLLEWNYGGMGEFYFPGKKIGLGFGYGLADSMVLNISDLPSSDSFKTTYRRLALILRNNSKVSLYGQLYGDGNWGFGLQWGGFW